MSDVGNKINVLPVNWLHYDDCTDDNSVDLADTLIAVDKYDYIIYAHNNMIIYFKRHQIEQYISKADSGYESKPYADPVKTKSSGPEPWKCLKVDKNIKCMKLSCDYNLIGIIYHDGSLEVISLPALLNQNTKSCVYQNDDKHVISIEWNPKEDRLLLLVKNDGIYRANIRTGTMELIDDNDKVTNISWFNESIFVASLSNNTNIIKFYFNKGLDSIDKKENVKNLSEVYSVVEIKGLKCVSVATTSNTREVIIEVLALTETKELFLLRLVEASNDVEVLECDWCQSYDANEKNIFYMRYLDNIKVLVVGNNYSPGKINEESSSSYAMIVEVDKHNADSIDDSSRSDNTYGHLSKKNLSGDEIDKKVCGMCVLNNLLGSHAGFVLLVLFSDGKLQVSLGETEAIRGKYAQVSKIEDKIIPYNEFVPVTIPDNADVRDDDVVGPQVNVVNFANINIDSLNNELNELEALSRSIKAKLCCYESIQEANKANKIKCDGYTGELDTLLKQNIDMDNVEPRLESASVFHNRGRDRKSANCQSKSGLSWHKLLSLASSHEIFHEDENDAPIITTKAVNSQNTLLIFNRKKSAKIVAIKGGKNVAIVTEKPPVQAMVDNSNTVRVEPILRVRTVPDQVISGAQKVQAMVDNSNTVRVEPILRVPTVPDRVISGAQKTDDFKFFPFSFGALDISKEVSATNLTKNVSVTETPGSSEDEKTINEIKELFKRFNPEKIGQVEGLLKKNIPNDLLQRIKAKYMKDDNNTPQVNVPSSAITAPPSAKDSQSLAKAQAPFDLARMTQSLPVSIAKTASTEKSDNVKSLPLPLGAFDIRKQNTETFKTVSVTETPGSSEDEKTINEIKELFKRFNPEKIGQVEGLLKNNTPNELLQRIKAKYMKDDNNTPQVNVPSSAITAPPSRTKGALSLMRTQSSPSSATAVSSWGVPAAQPQLKAQSPSGPTIGTSLFGQSSQLGIGQQPLLTRASSNPATGAPVFGTSSPVLFGGGSVFGINGTNDQSTEATINEIKELFKRFNPEKIGQVEELLKKNTPNELLQRIKAKYMKDDNNTPQVNAQWGVSSSTLMRTQSSPSSATAVSSWGVPAAQPQLKAQSPSGPTIGTSLFGQSSQLGIGQQPLLTRASSNPATGAPVFGTSSPVLFGGGSVFAGAPVFGTSSPVTLGGGSVFGTNATNGQSFGQVSQAGSSSPGRTGIFGANAFSSQSQLNVQGNQPTFSQTTQPVQTIFGSKSPPVTSGQVFGQTSQLGNSNLSNWSYR